MYRQVLGYSQHPITAGLLLVSAGFKLFNDQVSARFLRVSAGFSYPMYQIIAGSIILVLTGFNLSNVSDSRLSQVFYVYQQVLGYQIQMYQVTLMQGSD